MPSLSRLTIRLARVDARIAEIEAAYGKAALVASYSRGTAGASTTYQPLKEIAAEYHRLLDEQENLSAAIDEMNGTGTGGVSLASPREVSG